ncbi:hypothetical protein J5Y04_14035 [Kitasatospora sp. RG8]|uniref:hypothetical protein n=1 Tax=Kitasatospora sp. RG8 TaxID=2820815 RepID=UPI001ADEFBA1|nr:hypothetical protein [Kitasatospora sp. RG8]MBP0450657.1 hypothetical protein [Kitasatospora sp. RG8]
MTDTPDADRSSNAGDGLRESIQHARQRLGQSIEEITSKIEGETQVQVRAAQVKNRLHSTTAGATAHARDKATQATHSGQAAVSHAKEHLAHTAAAVAHTVQEKTPEPLREAAVRTGQVSRKSLTLVLVGAGAAACVLAVVVHRRRARTAPTRSRVC